MISMLLRASFSIPIGELVGNFPLISCSSRQVIHTRISIHPKVPLWEISSYFPLFPGKYPDIGKLTNFRLAGITQYLLKTLGKQMNVHPLGWRILPMENSMQDLSVL